MTETTGEKSWDPEVTVSPELVRKLKKSKNVYLGRKDICSIEIAQSAVRLPTFNLQVRAKNAGRKTRSAPLQSRESLSMN